VAPTSTSTSSTRKPARDRSSHGCSSRRSERRSSSLAAAAEPTQRDIDSRNAVVPGTARAGPEAAAAGPTPVRLPAAPRRYQLKGNHMNLFTKQTRTLGGALVALLTLIPAGMTLAGDAEAQAVLPPLKTITTLGSTIPANGDLNPYGVAQIKRTIGNLRAGH